MVRKDKPWRNAEIKQGITTDTTYIMCQLCFYDFIRNLQKHWFTCSSAKYCWQYFAFYWCADLEELFFENFLFDWFTMLISTFGALHSTFSEHNLSYWFQTCLCVPKVTIFGCLCPVFLSRSSDYCLPKVFKNHNFPIQVCSSSTWERPGRSSCWLPVPSQPLRTQLMCVSSLPVRMGRELSLSSLSTLGQHPLLVVLHLEPSPIRYR